MIIDRRIEGDDETIKKALTQADPLILKTIIFQLEGDTTIRDLPLITVPAMNGAMMVPILSPDYDETVRARAFELLKKWRDEKRAVPPAPTREAIIQLMDICAARKMSDIEHVVGFEELAFENYPRKIEWASKPKNGALSDFRVLVIGAGVGGIAASVNLQQAGIPYTVIEKEGGVGGTWWRNTYPDARVDIPSHFYSFAFETPYPWKHYFAPQPEIQQYMEHCVKKHGVMPNIRFNTKVLSATWNESAANWEVRVQTSDGKEETLHFNAIISGVGLFNEPSMPDYEGIYDFKGKLFHTSSWDHSYDYTGKRVGVIGTGPSTLQLAPKVAKTAGKLSVFQRTAGWVVPVPGYRDEISPEIRWLLDYVPYYDNWYRFRIFATQMDGVGGVHDMDPTWNKPGSVSARNEMLRGFLTDYLKEKIGHKPELVAKSIPDYPAMAKRPIMDNGWFDALLRDNVELVTDGIQKITPKGVMTKDGREHELDLLVIGAGFQTNKFLFPMRIEGRGGVTLEDLWSKDGGRAYLGITVPGFPNLFCLYGPNTNPKTGSLFLWEELQARYSILCIKELIEKGHRSIDVRQEIHDDYNQRMDEALQNQIWMDQSQKSYYRNEFNRVDVNMPWLPDEYFSWTVKPNFSDYVIK